METLTIEVYESSKVKPDTLITIPLNVINIGKDLLPLSAKTVLDKLGVNISKLSELSEKTIPKGMLIKIDTTKEKIVISIG